VRSVTVYESSGFSILDKSALKSVRKWRFSPGKKGDESVEMTVVIPVTFDFN